MTLGLYPNAAADMRHRAVAFLDLEADLLDRHAYYEWLDLWAPSGLHIVPIERLEAGYEGRLNHIFDDHDMRLKRVERLLGGHAPSATPIMRTVRSISRIRLLECDADQLELSSSLHIVSYRRQVQSLIAADVRHKLRVAGDSFQIEEKIVQLINSDEALGEMSFVL